MEHRAMDYVCVWLAGVCSGSIVSWLVLEYLHG
jgi:hypothetical protein